MHPLNISGELLSRNSPGDDETMRCSDSVIHLPIIAVIMDMPIMKINNGPIQFYQQQTLYLWYLARAVISDAQ